MDKNTILNFLIKHGIIAVVRAQSEEGLIDVVEALASGGVCCIEVTMTTPGALSCIETASRRFLGQEVVIGVGSVLDAETARLAILAGAHYIASPITSREIIDMAHRYGKPVMPGAFTPTEIYTAWISGGDVIKVFPAEFGGVAYIKAVRAPLPQIPLMPTGGVDITTIAEFVRAGVVLVGVGGNLVNKKLLDAKDYAGIADNARTYVDAFQKARLECI